MPFLSSWCFLIGHVMHSAARGCLLLLQCGCGPTIPTNYCRATAPPKSDGSRKLSAVLPGQRSKTHREHQQHQRYHQQQQHHLHTLWMSTSITSLSWRSAVGVSVGNSAKSKLCRLARKASASGMSASWRPCLTLTCSTREID